MFAAAHWHGNRVYARFLHATRNATAEQERVLLTKIRRNSDSGFGRDYRFDQIHSLADFVRKIPLLGYEDHEPYIQRVKEGDPRALFGPGQRVRMFALSSGTAEKPKTIPVTDAFLEEYRRGWNAFGMKALLDHPAAFLRPIGQISSRMDESFTPAGIPCGAISGLMAETQKRLVRKYYIAPAELRRIDDAAARYYTFMRFAVPGDVSFLITASPATQCMLAATADRHRDALIRDVRDGTLWAELPIEHEVRAALEARLRPNREDAARLERLAAEHGALLPKHYWDLEFLANWTGGTLGLHLRDFPRYFGDTPVRDIGLLASEGRVSIPIEDGSPAGILDVSSHFFEFVPRDRRDESNPPALRSHEVAVNEEYFVVMTTSSGLYRYDLGDLVRVTGFYGEAPIIEFLNKGAHTCSMTGEKLTERQVILAAQRIQNVLGGSAARFVLSPRWGDPPGYVLHVESADARSQDAHDDLAKAYDDALRAVNVEYDAKRRSTRLAPVRLNVLPDGFLEAVDRREATRFRRANEQYKHRYLYTTPGADASFPMSAPCRPESWDRQAYPVDGASTREATRSSEYR